MEQTAQTVEVEIRLPRHLYRSVERNASAAGLSVMQYVVDVVRRNELSPQDELAIEGYRELGHQTLEFAESALAATATSWPEWTGDDRPTRVRKSGAAPKPGTCRAQILDTIRDLSHRTNRVEFTMAEIVKHMAQRGTSFSEGTICTYIASDMCANAPINNATVYSDLERVRRGVYRLRDNLSEGNSHAA